MTDRSVIRMVKKKDLRELIDLCELHAIFEKSKFDPKSKKEKLAAHFFSDNPTLYCLVVEKDKNLVGYATFMRQFSTWDADFYLYMDCLFLKEEARGVGTGRRLMDRIRKEARRLHCDFIQWQTPDFNNGAIKFYERTGATGRLKSRFILKI